LRLQSHIPAEQRWEIAARAASAIPFAYDIAFREAIGEKYDEIEQPIYIEAGKEIKNLASALGLPTGNAREISETRGIIMTILYGPEFKIETTEEGDDRTVGVQDRDHRRRRRQDRGEDNPVSYTQQGSGNGG